VSNVRRGIQNDRPALATPTAAVAMSDDGAGCDAVSENVLPRSERANCEGETVSVIADIISDERRSKSRAVADERENMQYRMQLAGETLMESVKSLRSLSNLMERTGAQAFHVQSLRLQTDFVEQRATRLLKGE